MIRYNQPCQHPADLHSLPLLGLLSSLGAQMEPHEDPKGRGVIGSLRSRRGGLMAAEILVMPWAA
jgi:hypothetical protein